MNNVLGAILSLASTLREQPNAQGVSALDTIVNACLRGRDVVRSLLYFAHKDLSEVTVVDLNQVVRDLVKLLAYTTLKRVKLDMDLQEDLGALDGDRPAISNALMNICVNAMDAMEGTGALAIRTRKLPSGMLELSVQDTGPGMSPEVLEKAVEPFFTTKPQGKGTGLGLAMVYATMQAHHGTLELQSRPGAGTRVVLTFPASLAALPDAVPAPPAPAPQAALEILLVDDDELIRASVAPLLAMLGHRVQTAAGGLEAVRRMEAGLAPDLVILDMNMPGLNGADTLPRLLALRPDLPVLLATGYSDADLSHLILDRPRLQSIQKPFSLEELRHKLEQMAVVPAG
jgi:CheY-like chemotaxis protein/anti-sigma regulatory factor (Ser/Thr protein kinase)